MNCYGERRARLCRAIGEGNIGIVFSAPEMIRNGDAHFRYRQNSDFYYLTGFSEPEAVAVFIPGRAEGEYVLFNRPRDLQQEIWNGYRAGQEDACTQFGANQSFPIEQFTQVLPGFLENKKQLLYPIQRESVFNENIQHALETVRAKVRSGVSAPQQFSAIEQLLHEMRLIKDKNEIALMRQACELSAHAHVRAMQFTRAGQSEYQVEAELLHEFTRHGCRAVAYDSIVATGKNACTLHYTANNASLADGDLLLIDAGGEYENYAADITRTFPVSGHFSEPQRLIYELVLRAQLAAIEIIKPGVSWHHLQKTIVEILTQGLIDLGILQGDRDALIANRAYHDYYMHNSGHWLGLDVHDAGSYKINGEWRPLVSGMVLTVEPGLYLSPSPKLDKKWWNIGVRIEDDVLVTDTGYDVLSKAAPKTVEAITQLMAART